VGRWIRNQRESKVYVLDMLEISLDGNSEYRLLIRVLVRYFFQRVTCYFNRTVVAVRVRTYMRYYSPEGIFVLPPGQTPNSIPGVRAV
jgi:hypothetical protein